MVSFLSPKPALSRDEGNRCSCPKGDLWPGPRIEQAGKESFARAASFLNSERWAIALAVPSGLKVDRGSTSKQISRRSSLGPEGTVMRPRHVERAYCLGLSACRL